MTAVGPPRIKSGAIRWSGLTASSRYARLDPGLRRGTSQAAFARLARFLS